MNRAPLGMVRAGIILAGLISLAPGFCEAADKNPSHPVWRVENLPDSLPTVASNFTVYEVRANDLRFVIEYSSDDGGMKIRDTPKPFRVVGRTDLVDLLRSVAIQDTGIGLAMAGIVGQCVLPHVNTTEATLLYLRWPRRPGWGKVTWLTWPPPLPSDATSPSAWINRLGDESVVDTLATWVPSVRCDPRDTYDLSVLNFLGASKNPDALGLLRRVLDDHQDCQSTLVDWVVHGGLPIREEVWDLFIEFLPRLSSRPTLARDFRHVNDLWYDIARERRWPAQAARRAELELQGAHFVHNVVTDSHADSLLCSAGETGRVSPLGAMDSYAGDGLGPFLRVCRAFGRAKDAKSLEQLLRRFSALLRDPNLAQQWDFFRERDLGQREDLIGSFEANRDSAIIAMKARP